MPAENKQTKRAVPIPTQQHIKQRARTTRSLLLPDYIQPKAVINYVNHF